jgi:hypothetical protein
MIISAFCAFLTIAIHVVPAQFSDDMFIFAGASMETESHIKIGTAFVNVPIRTMLSLLAFLSHEIWTDLEVMTEVALVTISTLAHTLELVAGFDFALVVRVGTVVREPTLTMYELLANSICSKFVVISRGYLLFHVGRCLVDGIVVARVGGLIGLGIHL